MNSEQEPHDYEPGDHYVPMQSDPQCRICGMSKRASVHK